MTTQSVMTQTARVFGISTGSADSKGKQTTASGFDQIIDNNIKNAQQANDNTQSAASNNSSANTKGEYNSDKSSSVSDVKKDQTANTKDSKPVQESNAQMNKEKVTDSSDIAAEDIAENEELQAEIAALLQSIREVVMDILHITSEELDQLLAQQAMSMADLLLPENLQQLVLIAYGENDFLAFITNESLADTMNLLLEAVNSVVEEFNIPLTREQMQDVMNQAGMLQTEMDDESVTSKEDKFDLSKEDDALKKVDTAKDTESTDVVRTVTISKEPAEEGSINENQTDNSQDSSLFNEISTETDTKREQSDDLTSSGQFQNFVEKLVQASQNVQVDASGNLVQVNDLWQIANQIIERIKVSIKPDQTSMQLQLNPENLGKVNLTVQSKNGVMTAQFVVQSELSKEAIESQLPMLRETLNQQGLKVEAIEVSVSTYAFDQATQNGSGNQADTSESNQTQKKITFDEAIQMSEEEESDLEPESIIGTLGSQIDYTA